METKYGIIETRKPEFPTRNLLVVPHKSGDLTVSYPAFGPNYFRQNVADMQKPYSHPGTGEKISFRAPTISESISAAAYQFGEMAKPKIFDSDWFQIGYIVRTQEGVFANPPKDAQGNKITDEQTLKLLLQGGIVNGVFFDSAKKVNGVYLSGNDFGFAPYETFKTGDQDCDTFAESGLARLLEHTDEKTARNLREIASHKFYKKGVNVYAFDKVEKPVLRVVGLYSGGDFGDNRLYVVGNFLADVWNGFAFGVLDQTSGAGSPKSS